MSTQSNEHKSVNDSELEAAAGGGSVTVDGENRGKKVTFKGSDNNEIDDVTAGPDTIITFE